MQNDPANLPAAKTVVANLLEQLLSTLTDKQLELAVQLAGVAVGALTAIVIGILAYVVARQQAVAARTTKEIERQRLLHELERDFSLLTSTPAMWIRGRAKFDSERPYKFTVALTREFRWDAPSNPPQHVWMDSDRLLVFTSDNALLNSTILHEFLFWFRRVARSYRAGLLKQSDISELWRQTLPFATDCRYTFLAHYFGASSKATVGEDIAAVTLVLRETIMYCVRESYGTPCQYISARLDPLLARSFTPTTIAAIELLSKREASSEHATHNAL